MATNKKRSGRPRNDARHRDLVNSAMRPWPSPLYEEFRDGAPSRVDGTRAQRHLDLRQIRWMFWAKGQGVAQRAMAELLNVPYGSIKWTLWKAKRDPAILMNCQFVETVFDGTLDRRIYVCRYCMSTSTTGVGWLLDHASEHVWPGRIGEMIQAFPYLRKSLGYG